MGWHLPWQVQETGVAFVDSFSPFISETDRRNSISSVGRQRNRLETRAKAIMTSVIRSDTVYFGTL